jgi:hypothetical protein
MRAVISERRYYIGRLPPKAHDCPSRAFPLASRKLDALDIGHGLRRRSVPRTSRKPAELHGPSAHRDELSQPRYGIRSGAEDPPSKSLRELPLSRLAPGLAC